MSLALSAACRRSVELLRHFAVGVQAYAGSGESNYNTTIRTPGIILLKLPMNLQVF